MMIKQLALLGTATSFLYLLAAGSVAAQSNTSSVAACQAFSNYGSVFSGIILPMSVKDFAAMNSGQNQAMVDGAISRLNQQMSARDKGALSALGAQNMALFEEAAIDMAIDIVLSGQTSSPVQIGNIMREECASFGVSQIIEYQKSLYSNSSQGQGAPAQ